MAWQNSNDNQTDNLALIAVVLIVGMYVLFSYTTRALWMTLFGIVLIVGLLAILGWIGSKYYRIMKNQK